MFPVGNMEFTRNMMETVFDGGVEKEASQDMTSPIGNSDGILT